MVEFLLASLFKIWSYIVFGFMLEIKFTAIGQIADGDITKEDKKLKGSISLWMIPIYGLLVWGLFEPLSGLVINWPWYVRYVIWAILISGFEALSGWIYDKYFNIRPWDYSTSKFKVFKNGYTKWTYVPLWGLAGLILEHYSRIVVYLSQYFVKYIMG